jgi:hypothetical protein
MGGGGRELYLLSVLVNAFFANTSPHYHVLTR